MKTAKRPLLLAALAGFLAGCAVTWLVWPRGTAPAKPTAPASPVATNPAQTENTQNPPESDIAQTHTPLRGAEARRMLNEIKRGNAASVNIRFFATTNGKLSQQFINFFELTPAETRKLSDLIQATRTEMWKAANAQAQVSQTETGGVIVRIPPSEAGPDIYDKVMDNFHAALGDERFNDMMLYNGRQFENLFNQFGGEQRTITIEPGNGSRYSIGIIRTEPGGGSVSQTMELTLDEIKEIRPELVEFVPTK